MEGKRVDPITRKPFLNLRLGSDNFPPLHQGQTRVNRLGGTNTGDKAPTVVTDYLGKESPDVIDHHLHSAVYQQHQYQQSANPTVK